MSLFSNDDEPRSRQAEGEPHRVGEPLDRLSIEEIDRRVALLEGEIERLKAERARKEKVKGSAEALFKR